MAFCKAVRMGLESPSRLIVDLFTAESYLPPYSWDGQGYKAEKEGLRRGNWEARAVKNKYPLL